ncbi:Gfo/Idh/MocA family protein [Methylorubrum salsuginis]|uniref:Predicted dehydrogenase n=1 Tax=Methylorubrum salsuginis TaxID=414703 RepID=A0A1I4LRE7_9HYPH|nr:Gfo/Idh/MocA family oxidoreductase [Methylorubrum salsuginis]SFL93471.1 Predicted dehydrogenase [Methylorubrum salsuginis]
MRFDVLPRLGLRSLHRIGPEPDRHCLGPQSADETMPAFLPEIASRGRIALVGTGFVADFYMQSFATFPELRVVGAFDADATRLAAFCAHWRVSARDSLSDLLRAGPEAPDLVLNLTNPGSHYAVSRACLEAGYPVYSEKPLATEMEEAEALQALAESRGLMLASAPCSVLGEAAQTAWLALRRGVIGPVRLVYAELDDGFLALAPYRNWKSPSGAPWPYADEFRVGCTLEHAGYYLTWLMAMFGSVTSVVSASARLAADRLPTGAPAPDFTCATLFFETGVVARLTCSIVAPHDHAIRFIGDEGVVEIDQCWDNDAAVRLRRRHAIRRRLVDSPFSRRIRIDGRTHPKVARWGSTAMNFALGPVEMLCAMRERRTCRLSAAFGLHLTEVTLAIQSGAGHQTMRTTCPVVAPMPWAAGP